MKKNFICKFIVSGSLFFFSLGMFAQRVSADLPWSVRMVESEMIRCPEAWRLDFQPKLKWDYCHGLELQAMLDVYDCYGDQKIYDYALAYADTMINADGTIKMYKREEYSLDRINSGKFIFRIYEQAKDEKYKKALALMRSQLDEHPRNADGGFWHKKIYPHQMWLDGVFMASPFMAEYAEVFGQPQWFDEAVRQITLIYTKTLDPKTGLLYHAWDESKTQRWANPENGQSRHFWGRATGWYMMAIVDVLDFLPEDHVGRDSLISIFVNVAESLMKVQDPESKLWFQVLDCGGIEGNYLEASGSSMFIYSFAKGVRKGYLQPSYLKVAHEAFDGIIANLMKNDENGNLVLTQICGGCGLGGIPYREGDYQYYVTEKIVENDPKGIAPFILAGIELHEADVAKLEE